MPPRKSNVKASTRPYAKPKVKLPKNTYAVEQDESEHSSEGDGEPGVSARVQESSDSEQEYRTLLGALESARSQFLDKYPKGARTKGAPTQALKETKGKRRPQQHTHPPTYDPSLFPYGPPFPYPFYPGYGGSPASHPNGHVPYPYPPHVPLPAPAQATPARAAAKAKSKVSAAKNVAVRKATPKPKVRGLKGTQARSLPTPPEEGTLTLPRQEPLLEDNSEEEEGEPEYSPELEEGELEEDDRLQAPAPAPTPQQQPPPHQRAQQQRQATQSIPKVNQPRTPQGQRRPPPAPPQTQQSQSPAGGHAPPMSKEDRMFHGIFGGGV